MMAKVNAVLIKVAELIGIMFLGVSLAVFFEYGLTLCSILFVESVALIALSKIIAYQTKCYDKQA